MSDLDSRRRLTSLVVATVALIAACGATTVPASPSVPTASIAATTASAAPASSSPSTVVAGASPTANTSGFAFAADDVVAYYQTQGYACGGPRPSTKAVGYSFQTCQKLDDAGRTRIVGVVTDPNGGLADGFASVHGKDTETIVAPVDALDPLSGFIGAMLGQEEGAALLTWLAGHLGDAYAETSSGPIKVATYTESADDHSTLYVEVAGQAYLTAPAPSGR